MSEESEEEFMEVFSKITGAKFVDVTTKKNDCKNCKKLKKLKNNERHQNSIK